MTENLTDEQLRERAERVIQRAAMALGSTDEWTDQETMIADFEQRFYALRAERAKPAQSDDMSKDHVAQAKEIASKFRSADRAGYKGWGVIYQALASIRAEGSAERAKLEAEHAEDRRLWTLDMRALKALLSRPAESGATERQCDCCGQMKECENVVAFGMDTTACAECRDVKNIEIRRRMDSMGR